MPLLDIYLEINSFEGTQRGETAGQVSKNHHVKEYNEEQVLFSWYLWHLTKEDMVVQATAAMETGVISQPA